MGNIRGVILDVDGTLIDSNDAHAWAWVEAFAEAGHDVSFDAVRQRIGMGGDKLVPAVTGLDGESREAEALGERRKAIFAERFLPRLAPVPGARRMVEHLKRQGFEVVVATSARGGELEGLLKKAGVDDLIEEATTASDVDNSKPDPDVVASALDKLQLPPEEVVMIGDTPYDMEAARRAGVKMIAFLSGGWEADDFPGAAAVYAGPHELLERDDALGTKS